MSFFEVFEPGLRHLREERERRRVLVANPTHGGGAPLGIDLDAGTATIVIPAPVAEDLPETPTGSTPDPARSDGDSTPAA